MTIEDWLAEQANNRLARRWFETSNPAAYVGTRHHTVPRFLLAKFADSGRRLQIWRRATDQITPGSAEDLAIRDFYTTKSIDGTFDGRMEEQLGQVEKDAAPVLDWLVSPFRGRALNQQKQVALCALVAFQMVRGPRKRKEIELEADYTWKTVNGHALTQAELRDTIVVPHPNEHIRLMGPLSEQIFLSILRRPVTVITLDRPLLVLCDEPVLVDGDNHVKHLPECSLSTAERYRRWQGRANRDTTFSELIHIWPTKPSGTEIADAIAMPIGPDAIVVLGPAGQAVPANVNYQGADAADLAREVNDALVAQAYEWIAASPGHPTFSGWTFPPPSPLIGICDGGSITSQQLQTAPIMKWQRIRKDW